MLDVRYSHLYFHQSLNRLQRGLSAIVELLVLITEHKMYMLINPLIVDLPERLGYMLATSYSEESGD